jgi:hypothetical protein
MNPGYIYLDKVEIKEFTPFYPAVNRVGTVLRNNMVATMQVKDLEVCQGNLCVLIKIMIRSTGKEEFHSSSL